MLLIGLNEHMICICTLRRKLSTIQLAMCNYLAIRFLHEMNSLMRQVLPQPAIKLVPTFTFSLRFRFIQERYGKRDKGEGNM